MAMLESNIVNKTSTKGIWVLGTAAFLVTADIRAMSPLLLAISSYFQIRGSTAGLLVTAYSIPYGLFQLCYGPLAEKIGKVRTIILAIALYGISTIICGFVSSFKWLLILRFVSGMFAAGIIPIALAHIGDSVEFSERQQALGAFFSMSTSGQVMGMVIGGAISQFLNWQMFFIILGVIAILAALLISKQHNSISEESLKSDLALKEQYRLLFSRKGTFILYGVVFCEGITLFAGLAFLGLYINETFGLSYSISGLILALFSASAFVSSFFISKIAQKMGQTNMPFLGALFMAAGIGTICLSPTIIALCIGLILAGGGYCICHTTLQTYATELLPQARATAMSFFSFSVFLGSGLGPFWLGYIYDVDGASIMLESLAISLFGLALLCLISFKFFYKKT